MYVCRIRFQLLQLIITLDLSVIKSTSSFTSRDIKRLNSGLTSIEFKMKYLDARDKKCDAWYSHHYRFK